MEGCEKLLDISNTYPTISGVLLKYNNCRFNHVIIVKATRTKVVGATHVLGQIYNLLILVISYASALIQKKKYNN